MSALGRKQTYAPHNGMSALPPKTDMCAALPDVCYGPKADMSLVLRELLAHSFRISVVAGSKNWPDHAVHALRPKLVEGCWLEVLADEHTAVRYAAFQSTAAIARWITHTAATEPMA